MHIKFYIFSMLSIFFLSTFTSCKSDVDPRVKDIESQVMAIHDKIMPEMSTMHKLKKNILKSESTEESRPLVMDLEKADEAMMVWMAEYKLDKSSTIDQQISYLNGELQKVQDLEKITYSAINNAKNYLEKAQ